MTNICKKAEDVRAGQLVLEAGHKLDSLDIANVIGCGIVEVEARRPVRIAVISTGDEIVDEPGEVPQRVESRVRSGVPVYDNDVFIQALPRTVPRPIALDQVVAPGRLGVMVRIKHVGPDVDRFARILAADDRRAPPDVFGQQLAGPLARTLAAFVPTGTRYRSKRVNA